MRLPLDSTVRAALYEAAGGQLGDTIQRLCGGDQARARCMRTLDAHAARARCTPPPHRLTPTPTPTPSWSRDQAELFECAALITAEGAAPQVLHSDTVLSRDPQLFTATIALQVRSVGRCSILGECCN